MAEEFASFYRDTRDNVFRAVVATVGSTAEAEEVVAEAYARAFANWSSVARHPKPEAWVVVAALNYRRSTWRKLRRLVPMGDHEPESLAAPDPSGPTVSAVYALPGGSGRPSRCACCWNSTRRRQVGLWGWRPQR